MKYRIKIYTYKSGRQEFESQVKKWFGWVTLDLDGDSSIVNYGLKSNSREYALYKIDKHYEGNHKIKSIEFEYITK